MSGAAILLTQISSKNIHDLFRLCIPGTVRCRKFYNFIYRIGVQSHLDSKIKAIPFFFLTCLAINHNDYRQTVEQRINLILFIRKFKRRFSRIKLLEILLVNAKPLRDVSNVHQFHF